MFEEGSEILDGGEKVLCSAYASAQLFDKPWKRGTMRSMNKKSKATPRQEAEDRENERGPLFGLTPLVQKCAKEIIRYRSLWPGETLG